MDRQPPKMSERRWIEIEPDGAIWKARWVPKYIRADLLKELGVSVANDASIKKAAKALVDTIQMYDPIGFHPCGIRNVEETTKAIVEAALEVTE